MFLCSASFPFTQLVLINDAINLAHTVSKDHTCCIVAERMTPHSSAVWYVEFRSWTTVVYQVQRRLYQNICYLVGGVLLCNGFLVLKGGYSYMGIVNNTGVHGYIQH